MKVLSIAIPCFNSAEYMRKCIDSLLVGKEDVEILIVNDGSNKMIRPRLPMSMRRNILTYVRRFTRKTADTVMPLCSVLEPLQVSFSRWLTLMTIWIRSLFWKYSTS